MHIAKQFGYLFCKILQLVFLQCNALTVSTAACKLFGCYTHNRLKHHIDLSYKLAAYITILFCIMTIQHLYMKIHCIKCITHHYYSVYRTNYLAVPLYCCSYLTLFINCTYSYINKNARLKLLATCMYIQ